MINVLIDARRRVSDGTVECFKVFRIDKEGRVYSPFDPDDTLLTQDQIEGRSPIVDDRPETCLPCTNVSKNIVTGVVTGFKKRSDIEWKIREGRCTDCVVCRCVVPKGVEYYDDWIDDGGKIGAKALVIAEWDVDVEKTRKLFQENNPGNNPENNSEKPVVFSEEIRKGCPMPNPVGDTVKATERAIGRMYAKEMAEINTAIEAAARNGDYHAVVNIDVHTDDSRWRRLEWLFRRHGYSIYMGVTDITVSWENAKT